MQAVQRNRSMFVFGGFRVAFFVSIQQNSFIDYFVVVPLLFDFFLFQVALGFLLPFKFPAFLKESLWIHGSIVFKTSVSIQDPIQLLYSYAYAAD